MVDQAEYTVSYEEATHTVILSGMLRLDGVQQYQPIAQLLSDVIAQQPPSITLDVSNLGYLNSSGITTLSRFVLQLRKTDNIDLIIKASSQQPWQKRSLPNLLRLMPKATLELQ